MDFYSTISFYTYVRLHLKPLSFVKRFFPFDVNHAKILVEVIRFS